MKTLFFTLLFAFISISSSLALHPDDFKWEKSKEKNGIKIFRADRHKETGIVPIKAQTVLSYPLPRVLSVLSETKRKQEWIPRLVEAYTIEHKSKYERVEYARYDSPWPFNDRAFVISTKGHYQPKEKAVFISIQSTTHPKVPLNPEYVRGQTYIGSVYMKMLDKNKTFFEITLLTDFKGSIPSWIINIVQAKWPFKMFKNLKKQLKKEDIVVAPEFKSYEP